MICLHETKIVSSIFPHSNAYYNKFNDNPWTQKIIDVRSHTVELVSRHTLIQLILAASKQDNDTTAGEKNGIPIGIMQEPIMNMTWLRRFWNLNY